MPERGALVWLLLCAAFVALDQARLADGLMLPVPLIAALVLARVPLIVEGVRRHGRLVAVAAAGVSVLLAGLTWRWGLAVDDFSTLRVAIALLVAAALILALHWPRVRRLLLEPIGLDPQSPVHVVVAVAIVVSLVSSAVAYLELSDEPSATIPFHATDSMVSIVTDAALALAGVGLGLVRGLRGTLTRLGLGPLRLRQVPWAVAAALVVHLAVAAMERTESVLLPSVHALEDRFDYEFIGIPPLVGAAALSVTAGVGEELLFRGALQPWLGIMLTAALFATLHVQYQLPGIFMIFFVGVALGVLRRQTSTTFAALVHVLYDLGAFLADFYG